MESVHEHSISCQPVECRRKVNETTTLCENPTELESHRRYQCNENCNSRQGRPPPVLVEHILKTSFSAHETVALCRAVLYDMFVWEWVHAPGPAQKNAQAGIRTSVFRSCLIGRTCLLYGRVCDTVEGSLIEDVTRIYSTHCQGYARSIRFFNAAVTATRH